MSRGQAGAPRPKDPTGELRRNLLALLNEGRLIGLSDHDTYALPGKQPAPRQNMLGRLEEDLMPWSARTNHYLNDKR